MGWGNRFVGTLLGPERAGNRCSCRAGLHLIPLRLLKGGRGFRWGRVAGVWSYVENCTVDASIFRLWFAEFL